MGQALGFLLFLRGIVLDLEFLAPLLASPPDASAIPKYRVVSAFKPSANPGMPGPYRGQAVRVRLPARKPAAGACCQN
mgnify:CR=1 FL=1